MYLLTASDMKDLVVIGLLNSSHQIRLEIYIDSIQFLLERLPSFPNDVLELLSGVADEEQLVCGACSSRIIELKCNSVRLPSLVTQIDSVSNLHIPKICAS